jgi:cytosine/adenosine deaminase-related metal-dependent hydrolase
MSQTLANDEQFQADRPVVFRHATVLTIDPSIGIIENGDVFVTGNAITAVGRQLEVPDGTIEIEASGGILMPGMVDTHRHMWQTVLRGFGADWTLTNYFYFYYLNWGKIFRPEDIFAGNLLSSLEAIDAGVTTTVDWSHGLQTIEHADAAVDALEAVLLDATIVRCLLLPAAMRLLGEANWWMPKFLNFLPAITIETEPEEAYEEESDLELVAA